MTITIQTVSGEQVLPWLDAVAALRIEVFRDFPYLYDGDIDYERRYLATYAQSEHSLFVLALDGDRVIGVSTGVPLSNAETEFQEPFITENIALAEVFYFGESVLLRDYRGYGIGHRFFDAREQFARQLGKSITAFCAVERPDDHPHKPANYTPLDNFWQARGYRRQEQMRTTYEWLDINASSADAKPMVFWLKHW